MGTTSLLTIHTDGASRGNPGEAAFAYVITGHGLGPIEDAGCLGKTTNNQAEYIALIRALRRAKELGTDHRLLVHSDSELMVKQMKGEYRVKDGGLLDLYEEAKELCRGFTEGVSFVHVRRAQNKRADALCNEVLDGKRKRSQPVEKSEPPLEPPPQAATPKTRSVSEEALECLRDAESAWRRGDEVPSAETVWRWLVETLARHGVTALDADPRRKAT